jgi:ribosomal protein S18 acetylase RimI-like enzyme
VSTITLGLGRVGDAPTIATMSRELIEHGLPHAWTARRVAALIRHRESLVVTARSGRELVGFALTQFGDTTAHLALLAVAAPHRRAGLGRRLLEWTEQTAVDAGVFQITLEVRVRNQIARRFYQRLGYLERERLVDYYSGIEDALRLSHDLRVEA